MTRRTAVLWALLVCCLAAATHGRQLTVFYTNDLHLRFARLSPIEGAIAAARERGSDLLVLDAGDAWHDFRRPIAAVWGADEMVEWMNRAGYSAMAIGNHDLYWGGDRLRELIGAASFPVLCANLVPAPGFEAPFRPAAVVRAGSLSVLIVGLVTEEYLPFADYPWLRPIPPANAVREAIRTSEPVDLIVVLCHLPLADAARLARELPEVGLFVTGHSHESTAEPIAVGGALLVQAGAFGRSVGRLVADVEPGTGQLHLVQHELVETKRASVDLRRGALALVRFAAGLALAAALLLR